MWKFPSVPIVVRSIAIAWTGIAIATLLLRHARVGDWEVFFDDAVLIGAMPGVMGLVVAHFIAKVGAR